MAVTAAFPVSVNVQVFALFPPLEQAPDHMASRPFETMSVIDVPVANGAGMVLPTATLIPAGLEVTLSPLRPVAVTVSVALWPGGVTVRVAVRVTPPALAVIVTGVDAETELVEIAKVALVAPCATVTLTGTAAAVLLPDSVAVNPPAGAALVSVTVPCDAVPPVTLAGLTASDDNEAVGGGVDGDINITALRLTPPNPPPMVADVTAVTDTVLTVNVALVAPAATITLPGTVAALVLLLVSMTTAPPAGAEPVSVTVPCEAAPPVTLTGLTASDDNESAGGAPGFTIRGASCCTPPAVAKTVSAVCVVTKAVGTWKAMLVAP